MPRILLARGARRTEERLMEDLEGLLQPGADLEPHLFSRPVRVLVPSRSLREHLSMEVVRRWGRAVAGLQIQTLYGAALEVMDRCGLRWKGGRELVEVLARRHAAQMEALSVLLSSLEDGYGTVVGAVMDLLDAGFEAAHAEALMECMAEGVDEGLGKEEMERALAVVEVARRVWVEITRWGIYPPSVLMQKAAELLGADPEQALPARALLIHGFADATGRAADFISSLMRWRDARVYMDHPPDPSQPLQKEPGVVFTERFLQRLCALAVPEEDRGKALPPSKELFQALGGEAEVREVGRRIARLLDEGATPERIAVVARDFSAYRSPLRIHFRRLGIPFSGLGLKGPLMPWGRRLRALAEVYRRREEVPVERWLDAQRFQPGSGWRSWPLFDLRLALKALGVVRLVDAAQVDPDRVLDTRGRFPLPVRRGIVEQDEGDPGTASQRRFLPGMVLEGAVEAASALLLRWRSWPSEAVLGVHLEMLTLSLDEDLGWDVEEMETLMEVLGRLQEQIPEGLPLTLWEFVLLMGRCLEEEGKDDLGGRGGGVQVLDVMEARGRTFDHLFIMGLNRDIFPRRIREDPILSDRARRILRQVLPDLPSKAEGHDEERYLFAHLLSSSPHVVLSWQAADEEGRPIPCSPLVERVRIALGHPPCTVGPPAPDRDLEETFIPLEHAVAAGLRGRRDEIRYSFCRALEEALQESGEGEEGRRAETLTEARLRILQEMDPDPRTPEGRSHKEELGPYFGFVGHIAGSGDPRSSDLYITTVESMAACPWQAFVERVLRLERLPDPIMEILPTPDPPLLGRLVHAVLERWIRESGCSSGGELEEITEAPPGRADRPEEGILEALAREEARRVLQGRGTLLPGLEALLVQMALPYLQRAVELEWAEADAVVSVLGVEVEGEFQVDGRPVRFRADRVDEWRGGIQLTDYKTGSPVARHRTPRGRRGKFLKEVRRGRWLQAAAYVLGAKGRRARGRFLFLRPDIPEGCTEFSVDSRDEEFLEACQEVVAVVKSAWEKGIFFPRLVEPDGRREPRRCGLCGLSEACFRGDSGFRTRWVRWLKKMEEVSDASNELERSLLRLWWLGEDPSTGASR